MQTIATAIQSQSEALLPALASLAAWSTILLAAASLATTALRRRPAATRCCVWQFTFVGLAALPLIYALLPGVPLGFALLRTADIPGDAPANQQAAIGQVGLPLQGGARLHELDTTAAKVNSPRHQLNDSRQSRVIDSASAQSQPAANPPAHESEATTSVANATETLRTRAVRDADTNETAIHWPTILVVAWALGMAANFASLATSMVAARRLLRGANPVAGAASFVGASWQLAVRAATAPILVSPNTQIPIAVGILRPRILLPEGSVNWPPERLAIALAHEQAHVERRDVLWQLIARLAAATYWIHPLTWLALRKLRIERERACDDRVLLSGVPPHDYAAGLVEVAAALRGRQVQLLGGLGMVDRSQLAGRIRSILNSSLLRGVPSRRLRLSLLNATACLLGVVGLIRPFDPLPRAIAQDEKPNEQLVPAEPADEEAREAVPRDTVPTRGSILIQAVGPNGEPISDADIHATVWPGVFSLPDF